MGFWIGTYSRKGGKGLYPLFGKNDELELGEPEPRIANASFAVWCPRTHVAYFVDEQEAGRVVAYRRQAGQWLEAGATGSGGSLPCYVSLAHDRSCLAVANYGDGSIGLIRLDPQSGAIRELEDVTRQSGRGPNPERQDGPHAHCAVFSEDDRLLYHVDLGLDLVFSYTVQEGKLGDCQVVFAAPAGSGPRHLLLHPDRRHALLLTELSAELLLLERGPAGFTCLQSVPTSPEPSAPGNLGGHLALAEDGTILITNRGHDSVVAFALERGRLTRKGWSHTGGSSPRHFHADAGTILVAHEESGSVSAVAAPGSRSGVMARTSVSLPGAAFIVEIDD
jgi:6-phosphogluconolactonase